MRFFANGLTGWIHRVERRITVFYAQNALRHKGDYGKTLTMRAPDITKMPVVHYDIVNPGEFAEYAAVKIAGEIASRINQYGRCSVALAGGSTPKPVYEALSKRETAGELSWEKVEIYFGDERCVSSDDPDSNYRMAYDSLLKHVALPENGIHRIEGERVDYNKTAKEYEAILPDKLDILILGMGEDGHTASIFPGSSAAQEKKRKVVAILSSKKPAERITITPPVVKNARRIFVLVAGAGKAPVLSEVFKGDSQPEALPVLFAIGGYWIVDTSAASLI